MLAQVQEMLYIEKGGDEQLKDELTAYNPLIPNGKEYSYINVKLITQFQEPGLSKVEELRRKFLSK